MKRWGKSPPLQAQARRHGKPHRVQGQIGDRGVARSTFRASGTGSGYWLLRQMVFSVPQGMQTEFGLQPFQNQQTASVRSQNRSFGTQLDTTTGTQPSGCRGVSIARCCSVNAAFLFAEPRMLVVVSRCARIALHAHSVGTPVRPGQSRRRHDGCARVKRTLRPGCARAALTDAGL